MRKFSSDNNTSITNQSENTASHYLFDPLHKQASNDVENKTVSVGDDLSESSYENDSDENISQALQNNNENHIAESEEKSNQSKFDYLKTQRDIHKTVSLIPMLTAALQTVLDILLIKEFQNAGAEDECKEENRRIAMKRPITLNSTEENENYELLTKYIKYNSAVFGYESINKGQSQNIVIKYWRNPNTLVDELRHLLITTEIGQQIIKVIKSLKKTTRYFYNNIEHEKDRKALTEELNTLKKTSDGRAIFSIINELQKAEIVEPSEDVSDYGESIIDNEDEKENHYNTYDNK